jgi:hypothetical protein
MKLTIVYFLVFLCLLASCKKSSDTSLTPQVTPIKTDKTSLSVSDIGSKDSFMIQFSGNWTLQINPTHTTWIKTNVASGKGDTWVYVLSQENNTTIANRIASITVNDVSGVSHPITLSISQERHRVITEMFSKTFQGGVFSKAIPTTDGGYIVTGIVSNYLELSTNGGYDVWIYKFDANGSKMWQKAYGASFNETANDIISTSDGGYLIVGSTQGRDEGNVTGFKGVQDLWLLKIDAQGNLLWQRTYGGTGWEEGYGIVKTTDGNYIIVGSTQSKDGDVVSNHLLDELWLIKVDNSGNLIWQKTYGGSGFDGGRSITKSLDGGYFVLGTSTSNDGDLTKNNGTSDVWVLKINEEGNLLWSKSFGGSDLDTPFGSTTDLEGNVIVASTSSSNDGDVIGAKGGGDAWLLKFSSSGNLLWKKIFGGSKEDWANSITTSKDGSILFCGYTTSIDGDLALNTARGYYDGWLMVLDKDGNKKSSETFGTTALDYLYSIVNDSDDSYILSGSYGRFGSFPDSGPWLLKIKY